MDIASLLCLEARTRRDARRAAVLRARRLLALRTLRGEQPSPAPGDARRSQAAAP